MEGDADAELAEKKAQNESADRKEYEKYRNVLGDEFAKTLEDFQNLKYNDPNQWKYIKGLKTYLNKYPNSDKRFYDIQEELREAGIKKGVVLPTSTKQAFILPEGKHDPYHIMHRMSERNIKDDDIRDYMNSSKAMFVQWGGRRQVFYSSNGVSVITKSGDDWIYKTAWDKTDFDESTVKILEVIEKHVK